MGDKGLSLNEPVRRWACRSSASTVMPSGRGVGSLVIATAVSALSLQLRSELLHLNSRMPLLNEKDERKKCPFTEVHGL